MGDEVGNEGGEDGAAGEARVSGATFRALWRMSGGRPTTTGPTTGWQMSFGSPMLGVWRPSPSSEPSWIGVESKRRWSGQIGPALASSARSEPAVCICIGPGDGDRLFAGVWKTGTPSPAPCVPYSSCAPDAGLAGPWLSDAVDPALRPTMPTSREPLCCSRARALAPSATSDADRACIWNAEGGAEPTLPRVTGAVDGGLSRARSRYIRADASGGATSTSPPTFIPRRAKSEQEDMGAEGSAAEAEAETAPSRLPLLLRPRESGAVMGGSISTMASLRLSAPPSVGTLGRRECRASLRPSPVDRLLDGASETLVPGEKGAVSSDKELSAGVEPDSNAKPSDE